MRVGSRCGGVVVLVSLVVFFFVLGFGGEFGSPAASFVAFFGAL